MHRSTILLLISATIILTAAQSSAQVQFTPDRKNSFALEGTYISGDGLTGQQGGITYTAGGKYDFSLFYNAMDYDTSPTTINLESTSYIPQLSVALIRPNLESNFGAVLQASYEFATFKSSWLTDNNTELTGDASAIGAIGYAKIESNMDLQFFPEVRIDYVSARVNLDPADGPDEEESISDIAIGAGITMLMSRQFRVTAAMRSFDGDTSWGITVGYIHQM